MFRNRPLNFFASCLLLGAIAGYAHAASYHVTKIFHIGGAGGWDYATVDSQNHLLYVTRSTHTDVIDDESGKLVADIPGQQRSHGVALVPSVGRGFITDGGAGNVLIFDLKTDAVLGRIDTARDSDGIVYDLASNKVLAVSGDAGLLIPISPGVDPELGKADPAIDLGGAPEFLAVDGHGKAYINLVDKDQVAVVDTHTMKVIARWPTSPGGRPTGLAIDPEHHRLFIGCRSPQKMIVMNADNGKVLADPAIGAGNDAVGFDNGDALASCRDGTMTVVREVSPDQFKLVQVVKTRPGARTIGVDSVSHTLYLPTAEFEPSQNGQRRPVTKPNSFMIVVVGTKTPPK